MRSLEFIKGNHPCRTGTEELNNVGEEVENLSQPFPAANWTPPPPTGPSRATNNGRTLGFSTNLATEGENTAGSSQHNILAERHQKCLENWWIASLVGNVSPIECMPVNWKSSVNQTETGKYNTTVLSEEKNRLATTRHAKLQNQC